MADETCWICFGGAEDPPPNARLLESSELIQICSCSLRVHKRCLVDWAKSMDVNSRLERKFEDMLLSRDIVYFEARNRFKERIFIGARPPHGIKLLTSSQLVCPQCKQHILLKFKPTEALSLSRIVWSVAASKPTGFLLASAGLLAGFSLSARAGFQLWSTVAGEGLVKEMLNSQHPFTTVPGADGRYNSPAKLIPDLFSLATFPLILYNARSKATLTGYLTGQLWTALLCYKGLTTPRLFMLFFQLSALGYKAIKQTTINRLYYRWISRVDSSYARAIHETEYKEIEENATEFAHSDAKKQLDNQTWVQKLKSWLFGKNYIEYSESDQDLIDDMKDKEERFIRRNNYEEAFHKDSFVWKVITTYAWPFVGAFVGDLISKLTPFDTTLSSYLTSQETKYLRNLIGMGIVAIAREAWVLFIAWNETHMYDQIEVVDSKMSGLKPVWALSSGVRHTETSLKKNTIKYEGVSEYKLDKSRQLEVPDHQDAGPMIFDAAAWPIIPDAKLFKARLEAVIFCKWLADYGLSLREIGKMVIRELAQEQEGN